MMRGFAQKDQGHAPEQELELEEVTLHDEFVEGMMADLEQILEEALKWKAACFTRRVFYCNTL